MKKIKVIGLMTGLVILLTISARAQYFYTSYGYAHEWRLPNYIEHTIYNDYYGYEVAHVERHYHHGYTNFDVLLHRGNLFLEVRFDRFGHVYRTVNYDHFPLMSHACSMHCGYHKVYYNTYYPVHHHAYYSPYSTTVYVTQNEPYHHHNTTYVNNNYTKVYVQPNGNNNTNNNSRQTNNYTSSRNNTNVQPRTNGNIHRPTTTTSNVAPRNTYSGRSERIEQMNPRNVTENRATSGSASRTTSQRSLSGRGNK